MSDSLDYFFAVCSSDVRTFKVSEVDSPPVDLHGRLPSAFEFAVAHGLQTVIFAWHSLFCFWLNSDHGSGYMYMYDLFMISLSFLVSRMSYREGWRRGTRHGTTVVSNEVAGSGGGRVSGRVRSALFLGASLIEVEFFVASPLPY